MKWFNPISSEPDYAEAMRRNWLRDFFSAWMMGIAQALSPVQSIKPTPPEEAFLLLPDLNSADADQLMELVGLSPEQTQQVIATRPHLSWENLRTKLPNLPENLEHRARL